MLTNFAVYVIALLVAHLLPTGELAKALGILAAITITAFVASFLYPFAALSAEERWQKFVLQYAPVALLGLYTPAVWQESTVIGLVVLACAGAIHLAIWTTAVHSRAYRLEQFKLGLAREMPKTARLIALLNGRGLSHLADRILKSIFNREELDWQPIETQFSVGQCWLFSGVVNELSKYCRQLGSARIEN